LFKEMGVAFPMDEGIHWFMNDYFRLDKRRLSKDSIMAMRGKKLLGHTIETGLGLLGTEPFKEYCRRHVDEWREERNLI